MAGQFSRKNFWTMLPVISIVSVLSILSLRPLLVLLTFWWPLLLSVKALRAPGQNVQFLLTYWLFYTCMSNLQWYIHISNIPFSSFFVLSGDLVSVWMFVSHGCIVAMYYYIPEIKGPHYSMSIVDLLDRRFIDPLVTLLWVKNVVLQKLLAAADCTIAPIDDLLIFNRNLCAYHASVSGPERLPFLQYSLEYFCYIDQPSELRAKYGKARGTLNKIGSFFLSISSSFSQSVTLLPPDKIPNPPSRVSSGTPRSRVSSGDKNKTTRGSHGDKSSRVSSGASERKPHEKRSLFSGSRGGSARNSRNISPKELDLVFGSANETSQNKHPDMDLLKPYPISHLDTPSSHNGLQNGHLQVPEPHHKHEVARTKSPVFAAEQINRPTWQGGTSGQIHVQKRSRRHSASLSSIDTPYPTNPRSGI